MSETFHERLAALDAWFIYAERHEAPLHIGAVYIFEAEPRTPEGRGALGIAKTIEDRLHLVPRYRQKVHHLPFNLTHPVWVDDPDFDLSFHVRHAALPKPGDDSTLCEYAARVFARPLDLNKPLWEMTVVEGLAGGRVAIINKVHHAMVDGISTVDLATLLLDPTPEGSRIKPPARRWRPRPAPDERTLITESIRQLVPTDQLRALASPAAGTAALRELVEVVSHSPWAGAASLAFSFVRPNRQMFWNRPIGPHRRINTVTLSLVEVKAVKDALGGTVNDVILAIAGEALCRWLQDRGSELPERVRVMCPVSVRDPDGRYKLGNQVSAMFVDLPTGPMPPLTRLTRVSAITGDLKRSRQAVAASALQALADWSPATLTALGSRLLTSQPQWQTQSMVNMVITNVPGPQIPFYTGGAMMLEAWPLVAIYHSLGLNIALTSYNGAISVGLVADRDLVPDLDDFAKQIGWAAHEYGLLASKVGSANASSRARRSRLTAPRGQAAAGRAGGRSRG